MLPAVDLLDLRGLRAVLCYETPPLVGFVFGDMRFLRSGSRVAEFNRNSKHWVTLRPIDHKGNRKAIGAQVKIVADLRS